MTNQEQYELICEKAEKYDRLVGVLDEIKAEIDGLTYYWCEVNPRNVIDDVLKIIDKCKAEKKY